MVSCSSMRRDPPTPEAPPGKEVSTTWLETTGPLSADSPSAAFLRDLAHASDEAPNTFDIQLTVAGEDAPRFPLARRFVARRRLGAGGFGIVYEAFDSERNATVALKILRRADGRSIPRFKNEFRSLVETAHENLVQLFELHAEGDAWFFTMELVRGEDALAHVRPSSGAFDEERLRGVLRQLADGLSFLHRSGKLHRDVKPSNVLVTAEGRVVIVDFGLVSEVADRQTANVVCGTPAYMAPELMAGLPASPAADWFAVGVMLYEALTGRLPWSEGEPAGALVALDARSPPPAPGALAANVPEDLDGLCVELLALDPARRPTGPEVRRRLASGRRDASGGPLSGPREEPFGRGEAPFIGRAAHLAQLHDALATAERGGPVAVLLQGRSGIGKSALLQRFLVEIRAQAPSRWVLAGRCFEQESVPYKGVDGLVDDLCRSLRDRGSAAALPADVAMLARLFPQLRALPGLPPATPAGGDDDPLLRPRAFAALRELVTQADPQVPVLAVDDLQWGDLDSTALLGALLHGRAPVLLVVSYRAEDAATNPVLLAFFAALGALEGRVEVRRVDVGALDDREAEALSRALLAERSGGPPAEATVRALVSEAGGDPFLLAELTRAEPGARRLEERSGPGSGAAGAAVPALGQLLAARLGRLPEAARRLLEVVALEGQPIARGVAAQAAFGSDDASEALGAVSLLRTRRMIRLRLTDRGEEILAYHDRIREVVTRGLGPETVQGHHHQLALALEASGAAEPERLLFHFRSAGRGRDAARYAAEAARRAHEALAFDRAARLYGEAVALGAEDEGLRVAQADALAGAGRPREAALVYLEAARGAVPADALGRSRRAAELLLCAGYVDEGLATLRHVLRDVDVHLSPSLPRSLLGFAALRVHLRVVRGLAFRERPASAVGERDLLRTDACYAAAVGLFLVNPILAAESQARHLLVALDAGEPFRVARALAFEAVFAAVRRGQGPSTARLLSTVRGIEQRVAHPHLTGFVRLCESVVAQVGAQWRLAYDRLVEGESALRQRAAGVSLEIDMARLRRTDVLWNLGEVAELSRLAPVLVDEARERGNRYMETMVQLSTGSLLGLVEGRPDRAKEAVAGVLDRWPHAPGSMLHVREVRAQARIALYEGRGPAALKWVEEGLSAARRTGLSLAPTHTAELQWLGGLAALTAGDASRAAGFVRACARLDFPWAENMVRLLRVGLARRAGDFAGAIALLRRARETARERGEALYEVAISRRLGEWIGGREGRAQGEAASAWMRGQGIADPERMTAMLLGWV